MANKSQTGLGVVDKSATMTGSPVKVLPEDNARGALVLINCSAHDILIFWPSLGNNSVAPTITAGASGIMTLGAAAAAGKMGGSYVAEGGWVPTNELWASGTASDILVCYTTAVP